MAELTPLPRTQVRAKLTPIAAARMPSRLVATRVATAGTVPTAEYEPPPPPTDTSQKPPEKETPWALIGAGALAVGVVGYVIYVKKFRKGR